jgi:hypothetical protein
MRSFDGPARVERECIEAFDSNEGNADMQASDGNEETTATPIMQPSSVTMKQFVNLIIL